VCSVHLPYGSVKPLTLAHTTQYATTEAVLVVTAIFCAHTYAFKHMMYLNVYTHALMIIIHIQQVIFSPKAGGADTNSQLLLSHGMREVMREFDVTVKNCTYLKIPPTCSTSTVRRSNDNSIVTSLTAPAVLQQQQQQQRVKRLQRAPTNTLTVTMPTLHLDLDTEQVTHSSK
jgi:hypothetical protein